MKTLTLRLNDDQAKLIEKVMEHSGHATASKAVLHAVEQYGIHLRTISALNDALRAEENRTYVKLWD